MEGGDHAAARDPAVSRWVRAAVAHTAAGLFITLLVLGILVVAMMYVKTPNHTHLPRHIALDDTVRVGPSTTMEIPHLPPHLASSLARAPSISHVDAEMGDAGVVIAAGGRHLIPAAATIHVLRHKLGCILPIEVWHADDHVSHPVELRALHSIQRTPGVTVHNLHAIPEFARVNASGSHALPLALCATRLRHVVLMAADALPLTRPTDLLLTHTYRAVGAVLFPDFHNTASMALTGLGGDARTKLGIEWPESNTTARVLPCGRYHLATERGRWREWAADGSLVLFDRARHWRALHAIMHLNLRHAHMAWFLRAKDSVWLGLELVRDALYTRASRCAGTLTLRGCGDTPPLAGVRMHVQFLEGRPVHVSHAAFASRLSSVREAATTVASEEEGTARVRAALFAAIHGVVDSAGVPKAARTRLDWFPSLVRTWATPHIHRSPCAVVARPGATHTTLEDAGTRFRVLLPAYVWKLYAIHGDQGTKRVGGSLWSRIWALTHA